MSTGFLAADPSLPQWRSPLAGARLPTGIRDASAEAADAGAEALGPVAGVAGLELAGPLAAPALRRLTDADLDALPALGPVAGVRTLLQLPAADRFLLWFPQEYGDHVVAAVADAWDGLS